MRECRVEGCDKGRAQGITICRTHEREYDRLIAEEHRRLAREEDRLMGLRERADFWRAFINGERDA